MRGMYFNECECPQARVLVVHGIPCILHPMCEREDCVSSDCRKAAQKKEEGPATSEQKRA